VKQVRPATPPDLAALVAALPDRSKVMALLASWCGLRFGELAELSRTDIDLTNNLVKVRRAVVRVDGATIVGRPKSDARRGKSGCIRRWAS
jgi:integrase